eukprot:6119556-Amphidinium_carterae.2
MSCGLALCSPAEVESGRVGVAQLFKYMKVLPHFWLNDAGIVENEGQIRLWREYVLEGRIHGCHMQLMCDLFSNEDSLELSLLLRALAIK